jgi:DNA-binding MarR family transcriptional regulator
MEHMEFVTRLRNTLIAIKTELGSDFPSQYLAVLLDVAANPDTAIGGTAKRLEMTTSSVSRAAAALSKWSWTKKEGHGLIEKTEDPFESRRKLLRLTQDGTRVVSILKARFES